MDNNANISLAVCVPLSWTMTPTAFFVSYTSLFTASRLEDMARAGVKRLWHQVDGAFPLDYSRNRLVAKALDRGATHVLFLDADMTFPRDLVRMLVESEGDVRGALYFKKSPPFQPVPGNLDVPDDDQLMSPIALPPTPGVVSCDVLGMGATLIKREVFEAIQRPWFEYDRYRKTGEMEITEDVAFCRKAKAAGFSVACDTRIVCGHVRSEIVGAEHWEAFKDEYEVKEIL